MTSLAILIAAIVALSAGCANPARVSATEFGDRWPLTVTSGILRCDRNRDAIYVTIDTGKGIYYGLNGSARGFYPDSRELWKPGIRPMDLQPLIDRGFALCR